MEFFDVLDEMGNKTGIQKSRAEVHAKGLWHKAVHIWILNSNKELLLQKRSAGKDSQPNKWAVSCGGHISAGDNSIHTAIRETEEELGLTINNEMLKYLFTIKRESTRREDWINREFQDVYLVENDFDISEMKLQEEEVSDVKYISINDFKNMVSNNDVNLVQIKEEYEKLFKFLEDEK